MIVIALLDVLFVWACAGLGLAIGLLGLRIALLWTNPILVSSITMLMVTAGGSGLVSSGWMCIDASAHARKRRDTVWKRIVWRYPLVIGPAAYYLGEYRPRVRSTPQWFLSLTQNRSALDLLARIAWYGVLSGFYLVLAAVAAAVLQNSSLFVLVTVLFAILVPVSGWAFSLLAIVVFVHAVKRPGQSGHEQAPWSIVPFVGVSWVRGVRQSYLKAIRPHPPP